MATYRATPPRADAAPAGHVTRRKGAIPARVPFGGNFGTNRCKWLLPSRVASFHEGLQPLRREGEIRLSPRAELAQHRIQNLRTAVSQRRLGRKLSRIAGFEYRWGVYRALGGGLNARQLSPGRCMPSCQRSPIISQAHAAAQNSIKFSCRPVTKCSCLHFHKKCVPLRVFNVINGVVKQPSEGLQSMPSNSCS